MTVRVIPRARKTELAGTRDGALLVRVVAPPVDDAANDAVVACLADRLGVPRRAIRIVSGAKGRHKRIAVSGVTAAHIREKLQPFSRGR